MKGKKQKSKKQKSKKRRWSCNVRGISKAKEQKGFFGTVKNGDRKGFSGVITVELSYLIPMILVLFMTVIYTTFYYHDKNILIGAASETAAVGVQMERKPDEEGQTDLAGFYQERIQGKLIFFSGAEASVSTSGKWVEVNAYADRGNMQLHVVQRAALSEPEAAIRRKWMLEKAFQSGKKKTEGDTDDSGKIEDAKNTRTKAGRSESGTAIESKK